VWGGGRGGDGKGGPSLSPCVGPRPPHVLSPRRSYSKQRAAIDREYGQVRRCRRFWDQRPRGGTQAPSPILPTWGAPERGTAPRRQWAASEMIRAKWGSAAPCQPWRPVADGLSIFPAGAGDQPRQGTHSDALLSTVWPKPGTFGGPGGKTLQEKETAQLCSLLGHHRTLVLNVRAWFCSVRCPCSIPWGHPAAEMHPPFLKPGTMLPRSLLLPPGWGGLGIPPGLGSCCAWLC